MHEQAARETLAIALAVCAAAALGDRIREAVEQMRARGDAYRAGYDTGYAEGYDTGYAEGRRVAKPVLLPTMRIGP